VPKTLTQYRVFIGSPGGLEGERIHFREVLERYSELHGEPRNVAFQPVGWEETIGGIGKPQKLINEELGECDYAVFVLHNRWGSRLEAATRLGSRKNGHSPKSYIAATRFVTLLSSLRALTRISYMIRADSCKLFLLLRGESKEKGDTYSNNIAQLTSSLILLPGI
jgi:hypothetical protein